jgi:hypothetical protein
MTVESYFLGDPLWLVFYEFYFSTKLIVYPSCPGDIYLWISLLFKYADIAWNKYAKLGQKN